MNSRLVPLLLWGILAAALAACGKAEPAVAPRPTATPTLEGVAREGGIDVVDMALRPVTVPRPVERVVVLSPTTYGFAQSFELTVVGKTTDAGGDPAVQGQAVGSTNRPDFSAIAALKPDLVLADASIQGALRTDFDQFPYPVFMVRVASYEDVLSAFRAVGQAVDREDRAEQLVAEVEQRVAAVEASIEGKRAPRVLILSGTGRDVYAGSDASYLGSLVRLLGGVNVAGSAPQGAPIAGYGLVEIEQAATLNPDVVLLVTGPQSDLKAQIEASPAWAGSAAVRQGRVVVVDPVAYLRGPGRNVASTVEGLARALYP